MTLATQLAERILALPRVRAGESRLGPSGKAAWFVSGREFAHLHADDLLDISLPRQLQALLKSDPRARFRKSPSAWLEFEFHEPSDVEFLLSLVHHAWAAAAEKHNAT
jgi:hypothetical protein